MLLVRTRLGPSKIHGLGLFAAERIAEGRPVWRYVPGFDVLLTTAFAAENCRPEFIARYTEECPLTRRLLLCADDARFINHSELPNVSTKVPLFDPDLIDEAVRDIEAGEELTMDYRLGGMHPFAGFDAE